MLLDFYKLTLMILKARCKELSSFSYLKGTLDIAIQLVIVGIKYFSEYINAPFFLCQKEPKFSRAVENLSP